MVASTTLPANRNLNVSAIIFGSHGTRIEPSALEADWVSQLRTIHSGGHEFATEEFPATSHPEAMVAHANFLSLQISRRRRFRIPRRPILNSASIGFGMASVAAVCGFLTPWAVSIFLAAASLVHFAAYRASQEKRGKPAVFLTQKRTGIQILGNNTPKNGYNGGLRVNPGSWG